MSNNRMKPIGDEFTALNLLRPEKYLTQEEFISKWCKPAKEENDMNLTEDESRLIGFAVACYLEDLEKRLKKVGSPAGAVEQMHRIEQITYTKLIPSSWKGPKPSYWK